MRLQLYADDYVEFWGPTLQSDDTAVATISLAWSLPAYAVGPFLPDDLSGASLARPRFLARFRRW